MTRPRKATVDYFPHSCNHGKTIFILEQRYGNDGYAAWFKILELLGTSEGHFIDCNDHITWEYLVSKTRLHGDTCKDLMDLLAKIDAIDPILWQSKIIWSQNFVDGIADVYKKRNIKTPIKPDLCNQKTETMGIPDTGNPQSKVKESKVKESKVRTANPAEPVSPTVQENPVFTCQYFQIPPDYFIELQAEWSGLSSDELINELKKARDWCIDNAKKKRKLRANGELSNPRLFLRNWLSRVEVNPAAAPPKSNGVSNLKAGLQNLGEWNEQKELKHGTKVF